MVKKIDDAYSLEEMRSEVLFSRAALKADPNAADFLPSTGSWLGIVATASDQELAARTASVEATASRTIANQRLDETCRDVGRALATELKNDRSGARWGRLFRGTVDDFVHQPLADQAAACKGWLELDEPILAAFREPLAFWANAAEAALRDTTAAGQARGTAMVGRELAAESLTRARDGLHAQLVARANERNLPRDFADGFFMVTPRKSGKGPKNGG
jgi:hypothetical protein